MANCTRFLAILIFALAAQAAIACSAEPYVSIQTLSVAQVAEIVKLNLREQYGEDAPDNIAIDSSGFKTGDDGKISSMRVSAAPWICTVNPTGSERELPALDVHLYMNPRNRVSSDGTLPAAAEIANRSEGGLPNAKANWRWETGVRIKIPSGWKAE